jgi:hypothetical protein
MTALHGAQILDFDGAIERGASDAGQCAGEFSGSFRGGRAGADDKYGRSVICSRTSIARRS